MAGGLTPVGPDELDRHPDHIAEISGFIEHQPFDPANRDPIIFTFHDDFEHWAQPLVGICDPFESDVAHFAGCGRGSFEGAISEFNGSGNFSCGGKLRGLNEQAHPFQRLTEEQRGAFAGEDFLAKHLAIDHGLKNASEHHAARIETSEYLQLG
jgi:hypothetical protein